jgi:hypothetical protein
MTEGLFVLTTIFIAYVVYQIVNEPKTTNTPDIPQAQPEPQAVIESPSAPKQPAVAAVVSTPVEEETLVVVASVQESPAVIEAVVVESAQEPASKMAGLKNPKTGEVVIAYSNYRFAKRWIKEALVSEGLLKKIYKNNEINADTEAKIKVAIAALETMEKYRA